MDKDIDLAKDFIEQIFPTQLELYLGIKEDDEDDYEDLDDEEEEEDDDEDDSDNDKKKKKQKKVITQIQHIRGKRKLKKSLRTTKPHNLESANNSEFVYISKE